MYALIASLVPGEAQGTHSAHAGSAFCLQMGCWQKLIVCIVNMSHIERDERHSTMGSGSMWEANRQLSIADSLLKKKERKNIGFLTHTHVVLPSNCYRY